MNKMPTAEEFFFDYSVDSEYDNLSVNCKQEIIYKALEFAKLHVKACKEEIAEYYLNYLDIDEDSDRLDANKFNKEAYPLTLIK
jgi:hypothetical protein